MAKNNGTTKRVTRKRSGATAPKTTRKPRLSEDAAAELGAIAPEEPARVEEPVVVAEAAPGVIAETPAVEAVADVEVLEAVPPETPDAPELTVVEAPPPPRAVSVWPAPAPEGSRLEPTRAERRFRRVAFVRAVLVRLRREAEKRSAPLVRRVAARFPRLMALRDSIRRWL